MGRARDFFPSLAGSPGTAGEAGRRWLKGHSVTSEFVNFLKRLHGDGAALLCSGPYAEGPPACEGAGGRGARLRGREEPATAVEPYVCCKRL